MIELVKLILAHLIGDFVLQPKSWVKEKYRLGIKSPRLYLHGLVHGVLVWLFLWEPGHWLPAVTLAAIHILIDIMKTYTQRNSQGTRWFLIDQLLHLISILIIWYFFLERRGISFDFLGRADVWVYFTAFIFLTAVCGIIIQVLLGNWAKSIESMKDASLPNAGKYIGVLERLLVFIFVVSGHWEAIGFLVAAKSVFRFGDLRDSRDRKLTEYFLIGTLLSFGIAIVTGIIVTAITAA